MEMDEPVTSLRNTHVIEGEWKLIVPSGRNDRRGATEFYNIFSDPCETTNLALTLMEITQHLTQILREWWPEAVPE
jgi:hypothetical protein